MTVFPNGLLYGEERRRVCVHQLCCTPRGSGGDVRDPSLGWVEEREGIGDRYTAAHPLLTDDLVCFLFFSFQREH